jgi:hypothetical protein
MDFLKKHYEKMLLGAVLLGLAGAVGFLFFKIDSEKTELAERANNLTHPKIDPLPPVVDTNQLLAVTRRLSSPVTVSFAAPHRLFNALLWQKAADGHLIKVDAENVGPRAVVVTKLNPLNLELTLDQVIVGDGPPRFVIGIKKEASAKPAERKPKQTYCKIKDKNDTFTVIEAQGAPDNPTNVVLELTDTGERIGLSKEQKFTRVDGYTADLKYDPEKKTWFARRVNSQPLAFNNEEYNIVAINQNEVVLSAKSNSKKWNIPYHPGQ